MSRSKNSRGRTVATMQDDLVVHGEVKIPYRYCYSRSRKTLGMTVRPDLSITVRIPLGTSVAAIQDFVRNRANWIARAWRDFEGRIPLSPQFYGTGTVLKFQGRSYCLTLETGPAESITLRDSSLVVQTQGTATSDQVGGLIDAWYRERAMEIFRERAVACHRLMHEEGIPLPPLHIRTMKSRWGSYSYRTRRITLNLNLVKAPQACLDYVLIHELCHIRQRHHGPGFWKLVERYVPDHAQQRKRLKTYI